MQPSRILTEIRQSVWAVLSLLALIPRKSRRPFGQRAPDPMKPTRILLELRRIAWALFTLLVTLGLAILLAAVVWQNWGPTKPRLNEVQLDLLQRWLPWVVSDLKSQRATPASLLVLHLANDPTDQVTDTLRNGLHATGQFAHDPQPLASWWFRTGESLQRFLKVPLPSVDTTNAALATARRVGTGLVAFGRVLRLDGGATGASLDIDLTLAETGSGKVLHQKRYSLDRTPAALEPAVLRDELGHWQPSERFLAWLLGVLLLPILFLPVLGAVVQRRSNQANAILLAVLTALDATAAHLVLGPGTGSFPALFILAVLTALSLLYNLRLMSFALHRPHP